MDYTSFMNPDKAFEVLKKAGGTRAARIIINERRFASRFSFFVFRAAWRLRRGVPVAKIIGKKWFYGSEFRTTRHTLDPRPDSETLVDAILASAKEQIKILDLGTGTGCLICSIVKNLPGATGIGIDKSWRAVRVARKNVKDLGLEDRIKIMRGDFNKFAERRAQSAGANSPKLEDKIPTDNYEFKTPALCALRSANLFDIIISNPPYIAIGDARVDAGAMHDPKIALYAGADGLDAYRAIAKNVRSMLKPGGGIFLEIGAGQGDAVREIFIDADWNLIASYDDLSGIERVLEFV